MKRVVSSTEDYIFGMTNIDSTISGIPVDIWSEHRGAYRGNKHSGSRVKIEVNGVSIFVSIEPQPKILAPKNTKVSDMFKHSDAKNVQKAISYIGRNYKLLKKHSEDLDNSYNDLKFLQDLLDRK